MLSESELWKWRKENLEHSTRDISVLIPKGADPVVILNAINTNKQLAACEISDIYKGINLGDHKRINWEDCKESWEDYKGNWGNYKGNWGDYKEFNLIGTEKEREEAKRLGVTYRITVFGDCNANSVEADVTSLLCGLGCRIREKNLKQKKSLKQKERSETRRKI